MNSYYLIKGVDRNGKVFYYTGSAGPDWVSIDRTKAFLYGIAGAQRMAGIFNRHTGIHGITFTAEKE